VDLLTDSKAFQRTCRQWRADGLRTALVPTMGFFHDGHVSLMRWARANAERVAVSLFVNPTQFGPEEDLAAYPRDPERDAARAREAGVDVLFTPTPGTLYAPGHATWVQVPELAEHLCGKTRPVHFRGVATVVTKLLLLATPTVAVFGEKDWQQLAIIRRMVRDLDIPVQIVGRPIFREPDGLAMSSRNVYLAPDERAQAPNLHQGLRLAADMVAQGERDADKVLAAVRDHYARTLPLGRLDYLAFVTPDTIQPTTDLAVRTRLAVAMYLGKARLIDNVDVNPNPAA
jgi:pantoate--beta-alanine ligase